jgi:lipid-A-disaccharide synthase-like uncharacterized protein
MAYFSWVLVTSKDALNESQRVGFFLRWVKSEVGGRSLMPVGQWVS